MIRFRKLKVEISPQTILEVGVPEWEVPIMRLVHTKENPDGSTTDAVEDLGEILIDRPVSDANSEFVRLSNKYGRFENDNGTKGLPYVAMVFGQSGIGQAKLQREIDKAVVSSDVDGLLGGDIAERLASETRNQNSSVGG